MNNPERTWTAQWKTDLRADGWEQSQIYPGSATQGECYRYKRDGWTIQIYDYQSPHNHEWKQSVSAWGPGTLAVKLPELYDWAEIQRRSNVCQYCKREVPETVRLGFAGRACPECREKLAPTVEYQGWAN